MQTVQCLSRSVLQTMRGFNVSAYPNPRGTPNA